MVMSLPPDFSEYLRLLNCHDADYLLVGGFAVGFHGYPRATSDMDIWIGQSPKNAGRVVAAIRAFGFETPNLTEDLFLQRRRIVRMGHPPIRIEVMNEIDGVIFEECRAAAVLTYLDGVQVPIISLADLKRNKLANGSPKDIDDLQQLP